jgi:hypothetical protein
MDSIRMGVNAVGCAAKGRTWRMVDVGCAVVTAHMATIAAAGGYCELSQSRPADLGHAASYLACSPGRHIPTPPGVRPI